MASAADAGEWPTFAGAPGATRYSQSEQINVGNAASLERAWVSRTGDLPVAEDKAAAFAFEATPIKVDDALVVCTPHSKVVAMDADTGDLRWRFDPHVDMKGTKAHVCRGVGYYADATLAECPKRVLVPTIDGRLYAVDVTTGLLCQSFGNHGYVNLLEGMGAVAPGYAYTTSPPTVINGLVILGGFVLDGQMVGEPSGVVRAFDARDGHLRWAWDMGHPDNHGAPPEGSTYTRGTPNAWAPFTVDSDLGLVYVPTGNSTPDFFGAHRSAESERYSSAIVALKLDSGELAWSFQTTHHDLWDYDVAAQPVLVTLDTPKGSVPAVLQATKRGQIFVLDRRNGEPVSAVAERAVPQVPVPGDFTSATQPYSVDMPDLAGPDLSERQMWGVTLLDQLWCRIQYKRLRYDGQFTPPTTAGSLQYPGFYGAVDWGGLAVDGDRQLLVVNTSKVPYVQRLIARPDADRMGIRPWGSDPTKPDNLEYQAQMGTPYASKAQPFLSPLGVPCYQPPWGQLVAIDLKDHSVRWRVTLGSTRDTGPLGMHTGLPLPMGVPSAGGTLLTKGRVAFVAATMDRYLRAFDTADGRELWHARLPAGGQAGPMTYVSGRTGKQYVVIAAGGHSLMGTDTGDYVIAYALPKSAAAEYRSQ